MLLSTIIYVPDVLDGASDVLHTCWCWNSCWFLIWSFVAVEILKSSAAGMASKHISKAIEHSRISWQHQRIKTNTKSGIIYWYICNSLRCNEEHLGEFIRTFGERFKEHLKIPSPIYGHQSPTDHPTTLENFSIVGREGQRFARTIKEYISIRLNNPTP